MVETLAIATVTTVIVLVVRALDAHVKPLALYSGLTTLAGSGLCLVGTLLLVGWRLSGSRRAAYTGMALGMLGFSEIPFFRLATMTSPVGPKVGITAAHAVLAICAAMMLVYAAKGPQVDSSLAWNRLSPVAVATLGLAALFAVVMQIATAGSEAPLVTHALAALTGATCVYAGLTLGTARTSRRHLAERAGWGLAAFGAAWFVQTIGAVTDPAVAAALALAGLVVMVSAVGPEMARIFTVRGRSDASVRHRWETAEAMLAEHERSRAEVRHEVRNALFGVEGAVVTLQRHRDVLSDGDAADLSAAIEVELRRAQMLLSPTQSDHASCRLDAGLSVDAWSIVRGLVVAARRSGHEVTLDGRPGEMVAVEADALGMAIASLLRNSAVHAPGAAVRISQESADGQYSIVVADDGPGFPTHSAHAAFSRGWRGPSAGAGEGMGLYVCRRGIRGYGGDVTIEDSAAGARVRIDLPLARSRALPVVDLAVPVQDSGRQDRRAIA